MDTSTHAGLLQAYALATDGKSPRRIVGNDAQRINGFRLSDIAKLIQGRHGGPCYCDELGRAYLSAALPHIVGSRPRWREAVAAWAIRWTPTLYIMEGEDWLFDLASKSAAKKKRYPATDKLSALLKVTDSEVVEFGLRILPSATRPKAVREADDKARRRQAEQTRRAAQPGHQPQAKSKSRQKPWVAEGMSRTDWYAAQKKPSGTAGIEEATQTAPDPILSCPVSDLDKFVPLSTTDAESLTVPDNFVPFIMDGGSGQLRALHNSIRREPCFRETLKLLVEGKDSAMAEFVAEDGFFRAIDMDSSARPAR